MHPCNVILIIQTGNENFECCRKSKSILLQNANMASNLYAKLPKKYILKILLSIDLYVRKKCKSFRGGGGQFWYFCNARTEGKSVSCAKTIFECQFIDLFLFITF
jgi:hypothetical protein